MVVVALLPLGKHTSTSQVRNDASASTAVASVDADTLGCPWGHYVVFPPSLSGVFRKKERAANTPCIRVGDFTEGKCRPSNLLVSERDQSLV